MPTHEHQEGIKENALESLKEEIISSLDSRRRAPLSWGSLTVSVILGVLALISIVQVVQSASLYGKLKSSDLKPAAVSASPAGGPASSLPTQVGGC